MASATVTDLAARALRRIGVAVVPASARPGITDISTGASIVAQALRDLGINPIDQVAMSSDTSTITITEIAARALRGIGVNPIAQSNADPAPAVRTPDYLAQNALKLLGVNPIEQADAPGGTGPTFTLGEIGTMSLQDLGVYASDETPSATDAALASSFASAFHYHMESLNAVAWGQDAIPSLASVLYTEAVSATMAPSFGKDLNAPLYEAIAAALKKIALSGQYAQTFAVDHINMVHNELAGLNLANWSVGAVPDALSESYSKLAAIRMAPAFGQPIDQTSYAGQPLDQAYEAAIATVRLYALSGAYGQTLAEARATSVHEDLAGKNIAGWASTAIPAAVADAYVTMTMAMLAPSVKQPADMQAYAAGMESVRLTVLSGAYANAFGLAALTNVHDALAGAALVTWTITTIPAGVGDAYAALVRAQLAPTYNKVADPQELKGATDQIAAYSMIAASQPLAEQVLREIHAEWRDRDMTRWEVLDIPRAAEESYIAATGIRLAPQFPGARSPDRLEDAETRLYRVTSLASAGQPVQVDYF